MREGKVNDRRKENKQQNCNIIIRQPESHLKLEVYLEWPPHNVVVAFPIMFSRMVREADSQGLGREG